MKKTIIIAIMFISISLVYANIVENIRFTAYDVTSTSYVYNMSGSPDATAGVVSYTAKDVMVYMEVESMSATSIDFIINCVMQRGQYYDVFTYSFTSAGKKMVRVVESCYEISLGVKVTGDSGVQSVNGSIFLNR